MSWSTGMAIALLVIVAVMWLIALAESSRSKFNVDPLAERKRRIAERAYRNSYNREWV